MIVYQNHHHDHPSYPTTATATETKASSLGGCASAALLVQEFIVAPSLMEQDQALQDAHNNNTTMNTTTHNQENVSSVRDFLYYGYEEAAPDNAATHQETNTRSMDDHPILAAGSIAIPKHRHNHHPHHARRRSSIDCPSKEYDIFMPGEDIPLMKMMMMTTPSSSSSNKEKKTPRHVHFHSNVLVKIILPAKDYYYLSGSSSASNEGSTSPPQGHEELWYTQQEFQSIRAEMRATLDQAEQEEAGQTPPNPHVTENVVTQVPKQQQGEDTHSTATPTSTTTTGSRPFRHRRKLFSFPKRLERTTKRNEALVPAQPQSQKPQQVMEKEDDKDDDKEQDEKEDDQFCLRGLEHHLKHRRNVYRTSKLRAWSAVFWEQRLQQQQQQQQQESPFVLEQPSNHDVVMWPTSSSSTENPTTFLEAPPEERTAHRYHVATQTAMEEAVARGAQDETAIQDYLLDVKQSLRRMSRNIPY